MSAQTDHPDLGGLDDLVGPRDDPRRVAVLEAAVRLLAEQGPHGLSLRRIAADAGGSTQLVYTLFGGKSGLADALFAEGFRRLAAHAAQALDGGPAAGDPGQVLVFGHAYRRFALDEPDFFSVMFGRAIPGFVASPATRRTCRQQTFGHLVRAVQQCLDAGTLVAPTGPEPALTLARACWSTVHGVAALEVAGLLGADDPDALADFVLRAAVDQHRPAGRPAQTDSRPPPETSS